MLIVDRRGRIVRANARAVLLFSLDETAGRPRTVSSLLPGAMRDQHQEWVEGFIQTPTARAMAAHRVVEAVSVDGKPFAAEVGLVPIRLDGEPHVIAGITDVTERMVALRQVADSLREKETLLQEIHHRVKNNLQVISSLLTMQADRMSSAEARDLLLESVLRVRSMALVHEQLYSDMSFGVAALDEYAGALLQVLSSAMAPSARTRIEVDRIDLTPDVAVPVGLILNELVTNAFKYGLRRHLAPGDDAPGRTGPDVDVLVEIRRNANDVTLAVVDSGPGVSASAMGEHTGSLGMRMIRALVSQLGGRLDYEFDEGSRFSVIWPLSRDG